MRTLTRNVVYINSNTSLIYFDIPHDIASNLNFSYKHENINKKLIESIENTPELCENLKFYFTHATRFWVYLSSASC